MYSGQFTAKDKIFKHQDMFPDGNNKIMDTMQW